MRRKNLNKEIEKINKYFTNVKFLDETEDYYVIEYIGSYMRGGEVDKDTLIGIEDEKLTISYNKKRWRYDYK